MNLRMATNVSENKKQMIELIKDDSGIQKETQLRLSTYTTVDGQHTLVDNITYSLDKLEVEALIDTLQEQVKGMEY